MRISVLAGSEGLIEEEVSRSPAIRWQPPRVVSQVIKYFQVRFAVKILVSIAHHCRHGEVDY